MVGLIVGCSLLVAAALNFRYADWITRVMWGGKPNAEHARRMHESPFGSRIGGSAFLAVCGVLITVTSIGRLL